MNESSQWDPVAGSPKSCFTSWLGWYYSREQSSLTECPWVLWRFWITPTELLPWSYLKVSVKIISSGWLEIQTKVEATNETRNNRHRRLQILCLQVSSCRRSINGNDPASSTFARSAFLLWSAPPSTGLLYRGLLYTMHQINNRWWCCRHYRLPSVEGHEFVSVFRQVGFVSRF